MTNKYKTSLRFDDETYEKIKKIAKQENRSMNNLVETWVKRNIEVYEAEHNNAKQRGV